MTLSTGKAAPAQLVDARRRPSRCSALAVASAERKDDVKLSAALTRGWSRKTRRCASRHAQDTGETLLEGQGEMHLRVAMERLTGKYGIAVDTHEPRGPLQGDDPRLGQRARPPQEAVRRPRPVRRCRARDQAAAARHGLRSSPRRSPAASCRATTSARSRTGVREYLDSGAARLPGRRRRGDADRRLLPHRRFLRHGLPHRGADRHARGHAAVPAGAARADPQGRDRRAVGGDAAGQRHRLAAARPDPRLRRAARLAGLGRGRGA